MASASTHLPHVQEYDSDDDFCWAGEKDGCNYGVAPKDKQKFSRYMPSGSMASATLSRVIPIFSSLPVGSSPGAHRVSSTTKMCIALPETLLSAIPAICKSSIRGSRDVQGLMVANTGATDHMLPDASAFISYKRVTDLSVRMGNNSFVPVLGLGTAVFALNGKRVLVRNTLHVPGLAVPLYSLRAHLHQRGCGFIGTFEDGFDVYFSSFVLSVDMASDCHLTYESLGKAAPLSTLHYIQPRCPAKLFPSETLALSSASTPHPIVIEDEDAGTVAAVSVNEAGHAGPSGRPTVSPSTIPPESPTTTPTMYLGGISGRLDSLAQLVEHLLASRMTASSSSAPQSIVTNDASDGPAQDVLFTLSDSPWLPSTMSRADVLRLIHHEGAVFSLIRPCDTANSSDKKTHWSAKKLHRAMGCRKFRNYKHLLQVSQDGHWVEGGKFPPSLGSFATVPKVGGATIKKITR
jgi:hypothetical protein